MTTVSLSGGGCSTVCQWLHTNRAINREKFRLELSPSVCVKSSLNTKTMSPAHFSATLIMGLLASLSD